MVDRLYEELTRVIADMKQVVDFFCQIHTNMVLAAELNSNSFMKAMILHKVLNIERLMVNVWDKCRNHISPIPDMPHILLEQVDDKLPLHKHFEEFENALANEESDSSEESDDSTIYEN